MTPTPPTLRPELPPLPSRMRGLPVDERGYPVPWFVQWIDGKPEFRAMDSRKLQLAVKQSLCWVCGQKLLGAYTFVIGPMCAVNRISGEPPCHWECAEYSARACPFLSRPHMVRRENDMPPQVKISDTHIARNPGVTLLWRCIAFRPIEQPGTDVPLFIFSGPREVKCFREGREATDDEIRESIESGLPTLRAAAVDDADLADLESRRRRAYRDLRMEAA